MGDRPNNLIDTKQLANEIYDFILSNDRLLETIKTTAYPFNFGKVMVLRCDFFTTFIRHLDNRVKVSTLSSQHDILKATLHYILNGGSFGDFEIADSSGRRIDINRFNTTYEVKTRSYVSKIAFESFIMDFFLDMCSEFEYRKIW